MATASAGSQWVPLPRPAAPPHCSMMNHFHEAIKLCSSMKRAPPRRPGDAYVKWYRDQAYYDQGAWRGTWKMDGEGSLPALGKEPGQPASRVHSSVLGLLQVVGHS